MRVMMSWTLLLLSAVPFCAAFGKRKIHVSLSDCQICQKTLRVVSSCPTNVEEYNKASKICSSYRTSSGEKFKLHCARNVGKTKLIQVCAVSVLFFDFCPEYDSIARVIQMDISIWCNATSGRRYYNSSDSFLCNAKCFQLKTHGKNIAKKNITQTSEPKPQRPKDDDNDTNSWLIGVVVICSIITLILVNVILFRRCIHIGTCTYCPSQNDPQSLQLNGIDLSQPPADEVAMVKGD